MVIVILFSIDNWTVDATMLLLTRARMTHRPTHP